MTEVTDFSECLDNSNNDYDSPWKEALEIYFPQFMQLLFPQTYAKINWTIPHEFLDSELQQIVRDADSGRNYTDKLVKVFTLTHQETWVLIHVEIQGKADSHFNERMYRYHYRLLDCYSDKRIASFAVLTNQRSTQQLGLYQQTFWETETIFKFPVINLQDWSKKIAELEVSPNPFSVVILAQLIAHKTHKHYQQRKDNKFALIRLLYQRGYERQEVLELLRFIDWMLRLPKALELQLTQEMALIEEEQKMKYVTSWERFALERGEAMGEVRGEVRGVVKGEAKALLKQCRLKFGIPPDWVEEKINAANEEQLDHWVEKILTAETIESLFA
jgi:hypothetical protein